MCVFFFSNWTARRSNQSILKEINSEYSLEELMLKLKSFGHLIWRASGKTLMLGKIEAGGEGDKRGWDGWMASPTQWTWVWVNSGSWWWTGKQGVLQSMGLQRVLYDWATEQHQPTKKKAVLHRLWNQSVQTHQFFGAQPSSQSISHIHAWPVEKP